MPFRKSSIPAPLPQEAQPFAFCEPVTASSRSRWHIRPLTEVGRKETGGADTMSLCGRTVAWDLGPKDVARTLIEAPTKAPYFREGCCASCLQKFEEQALPPRTL